MLLVVPCLVTAQEFELISSQNNSKTVRNVSAPAHAVSLAVADLGQIPDDSRPFQRYIWIPNPTKHRIGAVSYAINLSVSRASTIVQPAIIANGHLVRVDLRALAPQENDIGRLLVLWEKFSTEPYFHITRTTNDALPTNTVIIKSDPTDPAGSLRFKLGNELWFKTPDKFFFLWNGTQWIISVGPIHDKGQTVSVFGAHVGLEQATLLQGLTKSNAAIVRYDFFMAKALTTLDGGLYYDFVGIQAKPGGGKTAQEAFFDSLGVSEKTVESLRSDQRVAIFRSNVTGKPRRIDAFQGPNVRPGTGSGLITITHDLADENVDPKGDPIRNLLNINDDAREVIAERPNGMHIFALFDGKGGLQLSAPDNIVKDHTIPSPFTARLQPGISCIRCHGPHDGLQPFQNDVQKMLSGLLDVFDDLQSKSAVPTTLDRLAGLYAGDLTKPINRGRDDYSDAVYRATNGMSIRDTSAAVSAVYSNYYYDMIDAQTACHELGYDVPKEKALVYLNQMLPPLQQDIVGISPEDPIIGALKAGLKINRSQFEQIYADMAFRALQTQKDQQK
jgi:hypothetical protein